jgi:predicted dehydrogenase
MTPLRIVLMGVGLIGKEHASLVRNHPHAELVAIADVSPDGQAHAKELGIPCYARYETMLDEIKPDGAIVALPNQMHVAAGLACVERGVPMLMEKPVADTVPAALRLANASEAAGVPILIGHHRRHSPDIRAARRAVQGGELGQVVAVNGMWLVNKPDNYFAADWRRRAGGGPLLINLIHDIDCLRFICGEIDNVQATASNRVRKFEVEDTAAVVMRFESGALGTFLISDAVPSPYSWDIASGQALYFPHQPEDCYFIGGRKASLAVPTMNLWRHEEHGGNWQQPLVRKHLAKDRSLTYVNQLEHFIAVIRGEQAPLVTARDGAMTLAAILAVDLASREGRGVSTAELLG